MKKRSTLPLPVVLTINSGDLLPREHVSARGWGVAFTEEAIMVRGTWNLIFISKTNKKIPDPLHETIQEGVRHKTKTFTPSRNLRH